jgi:hypothetical protein
VKFDLKTPCKNCPFRTDATAIRFSCRERAEEIEESAYRHGFPCHLSAELNEDDENGGYEFGANTQHCAGALLMYLKGDDQNIPFERLSSRRQDEIAGRMDFDAPVFEGPDAFLDAYGAEGEDANPRHRNEPKGAEG